MIKLALTALLLFQSHGAPQTSFGFGAALTHAHPAGARFNVIGVFCGRKLVADPANTAGHNFYGNAICVNSGAGPRWYWYDWAADPAAGRKISKWTSSGVTITLQVADPDCLLALSAGEGTPAVVSHVSGSGVYGGTATLTATLTSEGSPLAGRTISFTLNGASAGTAVTNSSGVATVTNVSLSGVNAGVHPGAVVATFADDATNIGGSGTGALTVSKANQTITFAQPADKTFGDAPFVLSASSSSELPVVFTVVSGPASINGNTLTLTGAGTVRVRASQPGDTNYNAATPVEHTFNVAQAAQTITFAPIADSTFGATDFQLSATASSELAVSFAAAGACTVSGTTLHITGAGSCTVTASQAGDSNFKPAPDVARSFQIAKAATATAVVSSANPAAHGQPLTFTATVTSATGRPTGAVQFKVDGSNFGPPQTLDADGVASLSAAGLSAGAHVVTADYGGDANFNPSAGTLAGGQVVGGVFEFAQALFTVGERGGSVVVTVKRRGDASQAAAVEYATDDGSVPSVTTPCASVTGMALERCDYTRAQGLLQFAPGETEKTFSVLVNGDSYGEGTETTRVKLSNPTVGTALGETPSAAIEIADDTQQTSNPIDDSSFFVRQHYHDFLNREPDASGLAFWVNDIEQCGADAGCREVKRIHVSAAFFLSIEFQQTGYLVERMYKAAYGDSTDTSTLGGAHPLPIPSVRLQEFLPDTQQIGQGVVVGRGDWEGQLAANKQAYALEFVRRSRFTSAFPSGMAADEFVLKLDQNAGGVLTEAEKAALSDTLRADPADASKRAQVLRAVAESPAFARAESNRAFVLMQYFGYLRRNINSAPDADSTGYEFWSQKLEQFNGNFIQAEMVKAFISSDEYRKRFGQ